MMPPAVPPTTAPMIAPRAVEPVLWPTTAPAAAPVAAPTITPLFSLLALREAHADRATGRPKANAAIRASFVRRTSIGRLLYEVSGDWYPATPCRERAGPHLPSK